MSTKIQQKNAARNFIQCWANDYFIQSYQRKISTPNQTKCTKCEKKCHCDSHPIKIKDKAQSETCENVHS